MRPSCRYVTRRGLFCLGHSSSPVRHKLNKDPMAQMRYQDRVAIIQFAICNIWRGISYYRDGEGVKERNMVTCRVSASGTEQTEYHMYFETEDSYMLNRVTIYTYAEDPTKWSNPQIPVFIVFDGCSRAGEHILSLDLDRFFFEPTKPEHLMKYLCGQIFDLMEFMPSFKEFLVDDAEDILLSFMRSPMPNQSGNSIIV